MAGFFKRHRRLLWIGGVGFVLVVGGAAVLVPNMVTTRCANACINNLRQVDGAKEQWALEHNATNGVPVVVAEVNAYIKGGAPTCPDGGTYSYGVVDEAPKCTFKGHGLP